MFPFERMAKQESITLEYILNSSPGVLYRFISTKEGLGQWFCDRVEAEGNEYLFYWQKIGERATMIASQPNQFVRFQWEHDRGTERYFEFRIVQGELTRIVSLMVTDFSDDREEMEHLWNHSVKRLKSALGAK